MIKNFELVKEVISGFRAARKEHGISFKDEISCSVMNNESFTTDFDSIICKMGNISNLKYVTEKVPQTVSFRVKSNEYFIPLNSNVDVDAERAKLTEELIYMEGFLRSVQKKLSNRNFVSNAPEAVVAGEQKKEADALAKIKVLKERLNAL